MANNCHFYVAAVVPFSFAKEYEEWLCDRSANPRMWARFVKPYVRLCTVKEACEKSQEMADFFCNEYDPNLTEEDYDDEELAFLQEDIVLFVAEGWGAWFEVGDMRSGFYFFSQTENERKYHVGGNGDEYVSVGTEENYGFGETYLTELNTLTRRFGFNWVNMILNDLAPDLTKPEFRYLKPEELDDEYRFSKFLHCETYTPDDDNKPGNWVVSVEESMKLDARWQADFDQLNDDSDDTAQSETSEPPRSAQRTSAQTSTNSFAEMNAALKASLTQSQAALKASLAESQAALKKSLEDAMKGLK